MLGFLSAPVPRPKAVSVVGWIMWGISALYLLLLVVGCVGMVYPHVSAALSPDPGAGRDLQPLSGRGLVLMLALMVIWFGVFAASSAFLSLRAWGRGAVEVLLWVFASMPVFYVLRGVQIMAGHPDAIRVGAVPVVFAMGVAAITLFAIVAVRKPEVRKAYAAAREAREGEV